MMKAANLAGILLSGALLAAGQTAREPRQFFKEQIGLSDEQIATIARGKVLVKVLPSKSPAEIIIFGAVYVNAAPEAFVKLAFDMGRLQKLAGYVNAGLISDPPKLTDLAGFTLEPEDIKDLRICKPGDCGVQLTAAAMQTIQHSIDWSSPDATAKVNDRVRQMAIEILRQYKTEGNRVLGTYHDLEHPFDVNAQLQALLVRSAALPTYLPELNRYLLDYPNTRLADVESVFYWEKIDFGMRPMLRLNHAIAYKSQSPRGAAQVVAVKQLYASHYFQLALDLTACVQEAGHTGDKGFYLISIKGSTQQGLTGWKGSLLRRIVVSSTRSGQVGVLTNIKRTLEAKQ